MNKSFKFIALFLFLSFIQTKEVYSTNELREAVDNEHRSKNNTIRDKYRNPYETLSFFGLKKGMKVLEISPGNGWYSEILSNFLKDTDSFYVSKYKIPPVKVVGENQKKFDEYFSENKNKFGEVKSVFFTEKNILESKIRKFDMVLTFRNTHNWLRSKTAENVYSSIYKVMKSGGILGVVQHKADENSEFNFKNGYVKESFLIKLVEDQGFKLLEKSNINLNPLDTKDYKNGVWTLPPRLILGEKNKRKYLKIGESERMTLKFIKP